MTDVEPANDHHIESMKRFWEETPPGPDMRILNVRLLKQDFLSLIARLEEAEPPKFVEDGLEVTPSYWVRINSSGKPTFWEGAVHDGIPIYKMATAPNGASARNDFLEEAARICEALAASVLHPNQTITDRCAAAIRAAKAAPASDEAGK